MGANGTEKEEDSEELNRVTVAKAAKARQRVLNDMLLQKQQRALVTFNRR